MGNYLKHDINQLFPCTMAMCQVLWLCYTAKIPQVGSWRK